MLSISKNFSRYRSQLVNFLTANRYSRIKKNCQNGNKLNLYYNTRFASLKHPQQNEKLQRYGNTNAYANYTTQSISIKSEAHRK